MNKPPEKTGGALSMISAKHREYCKTATRAGLNYVTDILAGFSRRRSGKGWSYADADGLRIDDPVMRQRLNALVVLAFLHQSAAWHGRHG